MDNWTDVEWLLAFQKISPTMLQGQQAWMTARSGAQSSPWPAARVMGRYYEHIASGRRELSDAELVRLVQVAVEKQLGLDFIMDHWASFL